DRRRAAARLSGGGDRRGRGPHRAPVAAPVVGIALRRPWRPHGARAVGTGHRAVGPEGQAPGAALVETAGRPCTARALLRGWHRPAVAARAAAAANGREPGAGLAR